MEYKLSECDKCIIGYYLNEIKICLKCDKSCYECDGAADYCLSCNNTYYFNYLNNKCLKRNSKKCIKYEENFSTCEICKKGFYVDDDK